MGETYRRKFCAFIAIGVLSVFSGCSRFKDDVSLTVSILNYTDKDVPVTVEIEEDSKMMYSEKKEYEADEGEITEFELGKVGKYKKGDIVHIRATRHDVPFTSEESVILNCTPEHSVSIAVGTTERQVEIVPSDCG
jgi:hypothetical protein